VLEICATNAMESVNTHIRKAVRARGHLPSEAAALKRVHMALMSLDPTGRQGPAPLDDARKAPSKPKPSRSLRRH
jgi:transposase-like protein